MSSAIMSSALVSASEALDIVDRRQQALIDVRSEGEYAQGCIEGFVNAPLLTNDERHLVGIAYKQEGQAAAIALGQQLVAPTETQRVRHWRDLVEGSPARAALITCWRGGLRSQLVCERLAAAGCSVRRVHGGYKALRSVLLQVLEQPPELLVIGGLTGSGKTQLLKSLPLTEKIDLEQIARHRGSSFGGIIGVTQPSQAAFENAAAMVLRRATRPILIEDESASIGRVSVPPALYKAMQAASVICIDASLEERVQNLFVEYIDKPLKCGIPVEQVRDALTMGIRKLSKRLGGALATRIEQGVVTALMDGRHDVSSHAPWIAPLLTDYYDKSYQYAFARSERSIAFRGSYEDCRRWIVAAYGRADPG